VTNLRSGENQAGPTVLVLDSIGQKRDAETQDLASFIMKFARNTQGIDISSTDVTIYEVLCPQQQNVSDCGVYVLYFIDRSSADLAGVMDAARRNERVLWLETEVPCFRKTICRALKNIPKA
jgi:Ulp1 family protease